MNEYQYRRAWIAELKTGLECGTLRLENKRIKLRTSEMTLSEYEQFRRKFPKQ